MTYAILVYKTAEDLALDNDPELRSKTWASFMPYVQELQQSGVMVGGAGLHPVEASHTLRQMDGDFVVEDGPYADTKEQLAGFYLLNVPDMETALSWARKYPIKLRGHLEVRQCTN